MRKILTLVATASMMLVMGCNDTLDTTSKDDSSNSKPLANLDGLWYNSLNFVEWDDSVNYYCSFNGDGNGIIGWASQTLLTS